MNDLGMNDCYQANLKQSLLTRVTSKPHKLLWLINRLAGTFSTAPRFIKQESCCMFTGLEESFVSGIRFSVNLPMIVSELERQWAYLDFARCKMSLPVTGPYGAFCSCSNFQTGLWLGLTSESENWELIVWGGRGSILISKYETSCW